MNCIAVNDADFHDRQSQINFDRLHADDDEDDDVENIKRGRIKHGNTCIRLIL